MPNLDPKAKIVAMIVGGAFFMQQIDSTVINTALPEMARSMHTDPVRLSIGITGYLVSIAIFIPLSGWMSDRFGAKSVFRWAMVVFTIGSVLCGFSHNVAELAASRVFQGLGGAMMAPVGRLLLFRTSKKSDLVKMMTYLALPQMFGPILGPPLGGFITTYWSWPWIFLINVPFGAIGVLLTNRYIPELRDDHPAPLDWTSFFLSGASLSTLMIGLEELSHGANQAGFAFMAAGIVIGIFCVRHARRHPSPVLDLRLFKIPTFAVNFWGGGAFRLGSGSLPYLYPLLFQNVFGMSAAASGMLTLANAVGGGVVRPSMTMVLRRFGFRTTLFCIGFLAAVLIALSCLLTANTPHIVIFGLLVCVGLASAIQYTAMQSISVADVPQTQMSAASSLITMTNQFNRGLGVALAAVMLHTLLALRGATQLSLSDFRFTLGTASALVLLSLLDYWRLDRNAAAEVSGHKPRSATAGEAAQ